MNMVIYATFPPKLAGLHRFFKCVNLQKLSVDHIPTFDSQCSSSVNFMWSDLFGERVRCIVWKHCYDLWEKCLSSVIFTMINDKCRCIRNSSGCYALQRLDLSENAAINLLYHKLICVYCMVMPTAAKQYLYVGWSGWIIICLNWLQGERERCAGWAR